MRFFRLALHLLLAASLAGFLAGSLALWGLGAARAGDGPGRIAPAIAMQGEPALPADFACLPYADPHARKGGTLRLGQFGTFANLNPYGVNAGDRRRGSPARFMKA